MIDWIASSISSAGPMIPIWLSCKERLQLVRLLRVLRVLPWVPMILALTLSKSFLFVMSFMFRVCKIMSSFFSSSAEWAEKPRLMACRTSRAMNSLSAFPVAKTFLPLLVSLMFSSVSILFLFVITSLRFSTYISCTMVSRIDEGLYFLLLEVFA